MVEVDEETPLLLHSSSTGDNNDGSSNSRHLPVAPHQPSNVYGAGAAVDGDTANGTTINGNTNNNNNTTNNKVYDNGTTGLVNDAAVLPQQQQQTTKTNQYMIELVDEIMVSDNEDDELLSATPMMIRDRRKTIHTGNQKKDDTTQTVSLFVQDDVTTDLSFRIIVEPDDDDDEDEDTTTIAAAAAATTTTASNIQLLNHKQRPPIISIRDRTDDSTFMSEMIADVKETIAEVKVEIIEVYQEDVITPIKPRDIGDHTTKLSALALAVMVFYKVSGGPFGCEPTVKAAGPFLAIIGFTIVPIFVSIPEALVTAELGSAYPEPSGAVAWVEEAFGPKASLLCGFFHWVSGATDNAIYPSLFLKYVASYLNSKAFFSNDLTRFIFTVGITIVLSLINYSGLHIVGNLSIIICIISMSPFIIMVLLSLPTIDPNRWLVMPDPSLSASSNSNDKFDSTGFLYTLPIIAGIQWRPLLNNLFWNLNSFDVGASFAGEVRDPDRVFPRAMFLSVIFVVFSYLLPLLAALGAIESQQSDWDAGYFTDVAIKIGGNWLGAYTVVAAAISNIALFEAEMSGDAYQLMGMADRGLIPKWFTKRSRFATPVNGITTGTIVIILMSVADFDQLVEMLNFAYSLSILLEYAAFIKLRLTDDDVHRPYRIPLNTFGCICMIIPPSLFLIFLLAIASQMTYIYFASLLCFGFVFQVFQKAAKHYNWVQYEVAPKRIKKKLASPTTL